MLDTPSAKSADFLVEIHTEELPPKALKSLAENFLKEIESRFKQTNIVFSNAEFFATPRRLAVLAKDVIEEQPETQIERRGPALQSAFDASGNPTPACIGFAKSCGITPDQLMTIKNNQGEWVGYKQIVPGKKVTQLLPTIIQESLAALPIPKRMRWGNHPYEFVRPVTSIIMLYGNEIVESTILGLSSGRKTHGHRAHCTKQLSISHPAAYLDVLEKEGFVIADFARRKEMIRSQALTLTKKTLGENIQLVMSDALLNEVTGLVEWPVAVIGNFDKSFLDVPAEALISAMQDHQRYFPIMDQDDKLLPHFVTISNIQSNDISRVIAGNERVLRARLADAAFFYETDKKNRLVDRVENLKNVVFQAQLGTLFDKAERISTLSGFIAKQINENTNTASRAGLLAKADLTTEMVGEFPELQGIAGYYYAIHDGEEKALATALKEQYMPRFSGDALPKTKLGNIVALADRLDTLVGIFGIHQAPTGDKDPFALRRAALGVLRILIENKIDLDLKTLLTNTFQNYKVTLKNTNVVDDVMNFMWDRLKPWYHDLGMTPDIFSAVAALGITKPYDLHCRMLAVHNFKKLPEAESLAIANKRVTNLLAKQETEINLKQIDKTLFEFPAENTLTQQIEAQEHSIEELSREASYQDILSHLASLRNAVDDFFENVMVMTEDLQRRENRLLILIKLRGLFLQVADVALLVTDK